MDRELQTREAIRAHQKQLEKEAREYYQHFHHPVQWLSWLALFAAMTIGAGIVAAIIILTFY